MFEIVSKAVVGGQSAILASGDYAVVGMFLRQAKIGDSKRQFYCVILASVENGAIVGYRIVNKSDLTILDIAKRGIDGNGNAKSFNNSGTVPEGVKATLAAHRGQNVDVVWFRDILPLFRTPDFASAKVLHFETETFDSRKTNGNIGTKWVYSINPTNATVPVPSGAVVKAALEANSIETSFVDTNGNTHQSVCVPAKAVTDSDFAMPKSDNEPQAQQAQQAPAASNAPF